MKEVRDVRLDHTQGEEARGGMQEEEEGGKKDGPKDQAEEG